MTEKKLYALTDSEAMDPYYQDEHVTLHHGDARDVLASLPDNSVDAVVTDPPYGLANTTPAQVAETLSRWTTGDRNYTPAGRGFMGQEWDAFVPPPAVWDECYRVLKPGGHLAVFAGSRTQDLMGISVRLAGFDVRDSLAWLYGSGFPKSLDVGKKLGEKWAGWGTALKPAHEPILLARKPLVGTVAANVTEWGTGAINIDATRIGTTEDTSRKRAVVADTSAPFGKGMAMGGNGHSSGRFPANVVLDEHAAHELDQQSGTLKPGKMGPTHTTASRSVYGQNAAGGYTTMETYGDQGGASRFFYVAKAPKRERPNIDGVQHPTVKPLALMRWLVRLLTPPGGVVLDPFAGSGTTLLAAVDEDHHVIGVELEERYCEIIASRLA